MSASTQSVIDQDAFATLVEMIGPEAPEFIAEILETYLEETTDLLSMIERALAAGDQDEMLRPVHSIKSSSASVGALELSAICADLEQFLRGYGPDLDVGETVAQIMAGYALAANELAARRDEYASM